MKVLFLTTAILLNVGFLFSQSLLSADYLMSCSDTVKLEEIKDSAYMHLTSTYDYDKAIYYCKEGIELSQDYGNQKYLGKFYSYQGLSYLKKEDYSNAKILLNKSIYINSTIDNNNEVSISLINLGKVFYMQGMYDEALDYFLRNLDLSKEIGRTKGIIASYNNIGTIYLNKGDFTAAIKSFQNSLDLASSNDLKQSVSHAMENLGTVYGKTGDYETSLKYYQESNKIKTELSDKPGIINSFINIGYSYSQLNEKDLALETYNKALLSAEEFGSKKQLSVIYTNISAILIEQGLYKESLEKSLKAFELNKEINRHTGLITSGINISEAYMRLNDFNNAEKYISDALDVAIQNDIILYYSDIYETMADMYSLKGNYQLAYDYSQLSWKFKDSLMNLEIASEIEDLNIKYETEKKEKQIAIQELTIINQKEDIAHKNQINKLVIAVLLVTIVFILFISLLYLQKRKAYKLLVQQNIAIAKTETKLIIPQTEKADDIKYAGSKLSDEQKNKILDQLYILMQNDEIFLNRQLCIEDVAEMLQTNRKYLSQLINEKFGMNFNSYINKFRVHKARKLLIDPKYSNYTIEAIANESGFHSKATFNTAFKKIAGVTPSFLRNNQ